MNIIDEAEIGLVLAIPAAGIPLIYWLLKLSKSYGVLQEGEKVIKEAHDIKEAYLGALDSVFGTPNFKNKDGKKIDPEADDPALIPLVSGFAEHFAWWVAVKAKWVK